MKAKIARVIMYVKNPVALADWYCENFGFKIQLKRLDGRWIEINIGRGVVLALHGGGNPRNYDRPPQLMLEVKDIESAVAELKAKRIRMGKIGRWEHIAWCKGKDPEGNPFQLTAVNE